MSLREAICFPTAPGRRQPSVAGVTGAAWTSGQGGLCQGPHRAPSPDTQGEGYSGQRLLSSEPRNRASTRVLRKRLEAWWSDSQESGAARRRRIGKVKHLTMGAIAGKQDRPTDSPNYSAILAQAVLKPQWTGRLQGLPSHSEHHVANTPQTEQT